VESGSPPRGSDNNPSASRVGDTGVELAIGALLRTPFLGEVVRRILFPRTPLNKGIREAQGIRPWPSERKKARLVVWGLYHSATAPICFIAPSRTYSAIPYAAIFPTIPPLPGSSSTKKPSGSIGNTTSHSLPALYLFTISRAPLCSQLAPLP
jgi:hypothetical protein